MGIAEMFPDYNKSGAYYLEGTALKCQRVMALILLIALAYSSALMHRTTLLHDIGHRVYCSSSGVQKKVSQTE
jgi:hypothetical protein